VTGPDLVPPEPDTDGSRNTARLLEGVLIAVIVVLASYLGTSDLLRTLRDGSVSLTTVVYPLVVLATGAVAWTRRTPQ
jgi:hypothetical protein